MPRTRENTAYAQRLIKEYNHARKLLRKYLKKRHDPSDVTAMLKVVIDSMTAKQSRIIGYTLNTAFKAGAKEGDKIIRKARVTAAAATLGFDMSKVADTHLNTITASNIGHIGKYNTLLSKQLMLEYDTLLADNKLVYSLTQNGWTPWLDKTLEKRGISPAVIALVKGQTTTVKMISLLEREGIHGGRHPREISKMLIPHIQRYFGPQGVTIDHIGKYRQALEVNAKGEHKWVQKKITRVFRTTPKNYADIIARSSMVNANNEGRYQTLAASNLAKGYTWSCVCDSASCITCLGLHGQEIKRGDFPPAHPRCRCRAAPIWKASSGLKNRNPEYYFKQRDTAIYRKYQLQEFNSELPRGVQKLKFDSMLPEDYVGSLPDAKEMYAIRKALLE